MFQMQENSTGGSAVNIDITVEQDDGVFLAIVATDPDSGDDVFEYVTSDPSEIATFFADVDEARQEWARLRSDE